VNLRREFAPSVSVNGCQTIIRQKIFFVNSFGSVLSAGNFMVSQCASSRYCALEAARTQARFGLAGFGFIIALSNGKENDDEEANRSCRRMFIRPGDLPAWNCFE
jgi:hypothetical protein